MKDVFFDIESSDEIAVSEFVYSLDDGDFVHVRKFGRSVCGRDLHCIQIGEMDKPSLFVGGTHSLEWVSVFVCLKLAYEIISTVKSGQAVYGIDYSEALRKNGVVIVPLLNPDGYEIFKKGIASASGRSGYLSHFEPSDFRFWQANANGVDLNRNFNAGFYKAKKQVDSVGITRPAPTRYGGLVPFSEPETRAIRRLCREIQPRTVYALHSQGEEIYWKYGNNNPFGGEYIATLISALCGYTLTSPDFLASHAGLKDWFIKKYNRPAFTIELGLGKNPLPYDCFDGVWEKVKRAMYVATIV
ncbi:MAG: M14 family zinc carboxypeptidase [Oscillospiraceae bacterium]